MTFTLTIRVALQSFDGNSFSFWKSGNCLNKLNHRAMELLDSVALAEFSRTIPAEEAFRPLSESQLSQGPLGNWVDAILGAIFVLTVLMFQSGIVGQVQKFMKKNIG